MNNYRFATRSLFIAALSLSIVFTLSLFSAGEQETTDDFDQGVSDNSVGSYIIYDESLQLDITSSELSTMLPSSDQFEAWQRHLIAMCGINRACQKAVKEHLETCMQSSPVSDKALKLNYLIECVSNYAGFSKSRFLHGWVGARKKLNS